MQKNYQTKRLVLNSIDLNDALFIGELVNTPEWLSFIGDRNIRTEENAREYIQRIMDNHQNKYWVVRLAGTKTSIGIVTFIKRDYLEHYDIGFAFLSAFTRKGYAQEATTAVLYDIIRNPCYTQVLATTIWKNVRSIKLLERLGLRFQREIRQGDDLLLIYSVTVEKLFINQVTNSFYDVFTNADRQLPAFGNLYDICLPEAIIIKKENKAEAIFDLASFIKPRKQILTDGTLTEFKEYQYSEETIVLGNIAQRFSKYKKRGCLNGKYFEGIGNKLFQYVNTSEGWKIASVIWEDEIV